jgi:hypothetical protein
MSTVVLEKSIRAFVRAGCEAEAVRGRRELSQVPSLGVRLVKLEAALPTTWARPSRTWSSCGRRHVIPQRRRRPPGRRSSSVTSTWPGVSTPSSITARPWCHPRPSTPSLPTSQARVVPRRRKLVVAGASRLDRVHRVAVSEAVQLDDLRRRALSEATSISAGAVSPDRSPVAGSQNQCQRRRQSQTAGIGASRSVGARSSHGLLSEPRAGAQRAPPGPVLPLSRRSRAPPSLIVNLAANRIELNRSRGIRRTESI